MLVLCQKGQLVKAMVVLIQFFKFIKEIYTKSLGDDWTRTSHFVASCSPKSAVAASLVWNNDQFHCRRCNTDFINLSWHDVNVNRYVWTVSFNWEVKNFIERNGDSTCHHEHSCSYFLNHIAGISDESDICEGFIGYDEKICIWKHT